MSILYYQCVRVADVDVLASTHFSVHFVDILHWKTIVYNDLYNLDFIIQVSIHETIENCISLS